MAGPGGPLPPATVQSGHQDKDKLAAKSVGKKGEVAATTSSTDKRVVKEGEATTAPTPLVDKK